MDFDYVLADPTGNITVLITSQYTSETRNAMIQDAFAREPACEQVGFVMPCEGKRIRLEMMAYEFCGNATLSSASLLCHRNGLSVGSEDTVTVESSGAGMPIDVKVIRLPDITENGSVFPVYQGTLKMPVPDVTEFRGYPLIHFDGISHLLVPEQDFTDARAENTIIGFTSELGVPALGMMIISDEENRRRFPDSDDVSIRPLVYVPGSDTMFWETGCATGSTAIGYYRFHQLGGDVSTQIKQPGGIIRVDVTGGQLFMTGRVIFRSL